MCVRTCFLQAPQALSMPGAQLGETVHTSNIATCMGPISMAIAVVVLPMVATALIGLIGGRGRLGTFKRYFIWSFEHLFIEWFFDQKRTLVVNFVTQ